MLYIKEHFLTITRHRHLVIYNCFRCGIPLQGLRHDLSKYSPTEFLSGIKNYTPGRSPNVKERMLRGYSSAWLHHQGRNKHHFEYWQDYNFKTRKKEPVQMPVRYVVEMFCDRIAASKIYYAEKYTDSKPLFYYLKGHAKKYMHPNTSKQLLKLLVMLRRKGEDETFDYIKNTVKPLAKKAGTW